MTPQERVAEAEVERLSLLPHPVGSLKSEGRIPGSVMNPPVQWNNWVAPQWVEAMRSLATLPGDTAIGQEIPVNRVQEAGLTMLGMGPVVGTVPKGSLGMFAGRTAHGAPLENLTRAQDLAATQTGAEIWPRQGWFLDLDGHWKFEIPDKDVKLKETWRDVLTRRVVRKSPQPLADILDAPALFNAYPDLRNVSFVTDSEMAKGSGHFTPSWNEIEIAPTGRRDTRSVILHEIQHWIQEREGWAQGASTDRFMGPEQIARGQQPQTLQEHLVAKGLLPKEGLAFDKKLARFVADRAAKTDPQLTAWLKEYDSVSKAAHKQYERVSGEELARLTQRRGDEAPERLKNIYPPSQFETPLKDQIMILGGEIYPRWPYR